MWHKEDREKGEAPHTSIETPRRTGARVRLARVGLRLEKLHIACAVAGVWIPLAARLTPANVADSEVAPQLLKDLADEARYVLGDIHYDAPDVRQLCARMRGASR